MSVYGSFQKTATSLISRFGAAGTLLRTPATGYDTTTGQAIAGVPHPYAFRGVLSQFSLRTQASDLVADGAQKLVIDAATLAVRPLAASDSIMLGSDAFTIAPNGVSIVSPGGVDIVYTLQVLGAAGNGAASNPVDIFTATIQSWLSVLPSEAPSAGGVQVYNNGGLVAGITNAGTPDYPDTFSARIAAWFMSLPAQPGATGSGQPYRNGPFLALS